MKPGARVHYLPPAATRPYVATFYKEEYGEALIGVQHASGVMTLKVPTMRKCGVGARSERV